MWTIGISKARTLAPSVSLLIGQLMSGNLLYLKSLLNPMVYARRLTKYRQAFYKSFRREKNGKYSKKERGMVMQQYENMKWQICEVSPRLLFLSVLRILSYKLLFRPSSFCFLLPGGGGGERGGGGGEGGVS